MARSFGQDLKSGIHIYDWTDYHSPTEGDADRGKLAVHNYPRSVFCFIATI